MYDVEKMSGEVLSEELGIDRLEQRSVIVRE